MLRVKSLIDDSRNFDGFTIGKFIVRSMFETTSTHAAPEIKISVLNQSYLKLTVHLYQHSESTCQKRKKHVQAT